MKRTKKALRKVWAIALTFFLVAGIPSAAWANNDGSDGNYRVNDFTGSLSEDDERSLSRAARAEVPELMFDFNVYLTDIEGAAEDLAVSFYRGNNCGYGQDDDGIILCIKSDGSTAVFVDGLGSVVFSDLDTARLAQEAAADVEAAGAYEASYNFLQKSITKVAAYRGVDVSSRWPALIASGSSASGASMGMTAPKTTAELDWYPEDPRSFKDFHNENASRVVDNADLLTPEEEAQLADHLADMRQRLNMDFVLYTDTSSYGESRGLFAADFYQFNGYGVGDDYSGVIYFVCMEPGNRGFWTAARGGARELLTESNVNDMDDRTIDLFKSGSYGEAILTQFENLDALYTDGHLPIDYTVFYIGGFIAVVVGLVSASANLRKKRAAMKTVAVASDARCYSPHGMVFTTNRDDLYDTVVTRTRRVEAQSSGGSGGGGSSYSGSYSSSGGASFSGGGRSF